MAYISLATLVLFGTFITHAATQDSFFECMPGMPSPGGKRANRIGLKVAETVFFLFLVTLPKGDIVKKVGSEPFPLYCLLNPQHEDFKTYKSEDLGFYLKGSQDRHWQTLESEILNQTTIKAIYDPVNVTTDRIECRINMPTGQKSVCPQRITVGRKYYHILLKKAYLCKI